MWFCRIGFFDIAELMLFWRKKKSFLVARSCLIPQIAGSYRGSNFSKGGIVFANWQTSGCCSECCAGCCPGCCCGCCPGCSGSCLPLGGVRVLSRVLCRVLSRVLLRVLSLGGVRTVQGALQSALQGAPDHVCHWVVSGCCSHGFVG